MKMKATKIILLSGLCLMGSTAMTSCQQDEESVITPSKDVEQGVKSKPLSVLFDIFQGENSSIGQTRAIKTGTSFATGDKIGIYVTNSSGSALYNSTSGNVLATKAASSWTIATSIPLSATAAKVYAYYPYNSSATATIAGMKVIPVNTGTDDYLWGVSSSTYTATSATASITMKHALSQIRFTFTNSNSPNGCSLTNITLQDATSTATLYKTGTMDITTGIITNGTAGSTSLSSSASFKSSTVTQNMLMFPAAIAASTVKATFTIDSKTYTLNIPAITWEAGKIYTYPVQMVGTNLVLNATGITITDWVAGSTASATTFN